MIGIEIKHYQNQFSSVPIHVMTKDFGESKTDTSTWKPDLSIARNSLSSFSPSRTLLYDFPDGKDNGETVQTFIRSKGLDITEVESAERRITQIIEDKKLMDKEKEDKLKQRKKDLKDLSDSMKSFDSPESPESSNFSTPNA